MRLADFSYKAEGFNQEQIYYCHSAKYYKASSKQVSPLRSQTSIIQHGTPSPALSLLSPPIAQQHVQCTYTYNFHESVHLKTCTKQSVQINQQAFTHNRHSFTQVCTMHSCQCGACSSLPQLVKYVPKEIDAHKHNNFHQLNFCYQ